ncbi:sporulation related domain protein [Lysobacter antibioticus]|uniref:SPOR domain-containing protein n=1 Tax=Lysobacter antibioticus TaxID=84531 RepID=UPI0007171C6A|nr:SPOR domain-containing protein [Lysobacter antibioticus]ALN61877.1 sporulation related domain protein [Lysobacter antibioticus]
MEPALKQRLIGAMVLVALAVIFLPMLIKGPAPESGASDVPLTLPDAPAGETETRELPLVTPGDAPQGGVVGMEPADVTQPASAGSDTLPTVDTAAGAKTMQPASTAGGDYAVSFGSYASAGDADRVIAALHAARLPGYQETAAGAGGRTLYRVRIGPFATQADAEAARLGSSKVRKDVNAKVVVLNADAAEAADPTVATTAPAASVPSVSAPTPLAESKPLKPAPLPAETPKPVAAKPAETKPAKPVETKPVVPAKPAETKPVATTKPAETKPVASKPVEPAKPAPKPAAAGTGFAVQLGAFGNVDEANKLRDRARAAGFSAFVEQVRTDKGTLNRVRLGPVVNRADADKLKAQVAGKLGVGDALVKPHP